ncbi:hypothetical protein CFC21_015972 [Triticum aestivum]|uniref:Peptidase A1 domain-containing protein n=2 Tax=Triticum aestivum TaxID=4565 RepID=A0A3B6AUM0_WHEAT|nr:aspartic proteinase nepenthesin-1-like [Triticum dicoccoides]XP_044452940.1 aspartic proteinase nepenthesin-1-like [Triticum aestivum]KAF7000014.1 hypothetical protein CFC21_015972 [Triticum aestivum]
MGPLQALSLLLLASLANSAAPPPSSYRSTLTHIDSKLGFTKAQLMRRAVHRSRLRAATTLPGYSTTSSMSSTGPRLRSGQAEYLMELAIGTPPVPFVALADTGSDLTWTQCQPCKLCFPQDTPVYDPTTSSSFSPMPCSSATCLPIWSRNCTPSALCRYRYAYGDGAYSAGGLGTETLTFGSSTPGEAPAASAGGVAFGCGTDNGGDSYNSTGTVGLGRGSLSLVAQLGVGKFSYCLTDFFNTSLGSPVLFGSVAELATSGDAAVQSTPLLQSPQSPSRYYVSLEGISLGDTRLPIPNQTFALRADGTGGMIVDSGTIFTILVESAFRVVANHVAEVLGQPAVNATSLDNPCFPAPAGERQLPAMPDMVLHFAGGADMTLHRDNYMSFDGEDSSFCLNIAGATSTSTSVLGNFQQQNIHLLFDITVGQMSFVPTDCSKL